MSKTPVLIDNNICYFAKKAYSCEYWAAPINSNSRFFVIDIDRDGLEIDESKATLVRKYFQVTYKLKAWIGKNEGIIVIKKEQFPELFDLMDNFEGINFRSAHSPLTSLGELDYNKNSIIDSNDIGFKFLNIWRDSNQDMICQPEEVVSFYEAGINSIDLKSISCFNDGKNTCTIGSINYNDNDKLLCNEGDLQLFGITLLE